jgi:putative flavoprotein involved in K+ transport
MTQAPERESVETTPQSRVDAWLSRFESALKARDVGQAAALFATESYWRDLVSFTWNLKTVEGRDGVAGLLTETLETTDPSGFATEEPPDEADGVTTAWVVFETGIGRGRGLLRLVEEDGEDRAWTLLTALYELKGHEEARGTHRPMGAEHGANKQRMT